MAYIDTSVLVAYYCPEPLSAKAQRAISKLESPTISALVEVELHSAMAIKVRTREVTAADARRVLRLLADHVAQGCYRVLAIGAGEYALAREWLAAFTTPLRALDALHLAAAARAELPLMTADRDLARSGQALDVTVELLR
jgi:uncharacterized protein